MEKNRNLRKNSKVLASKESKEGGHMRGGGVLSAPILILFLFCPIASPTTTTTNDDQVPFFVLWAPKIFQKQFLKFSKSYTVFTILYIFLYSEPIFLLV